MDMGQTIGWGIITLLCALPVYFVWHMIDARRHGRRPRVSSGAVMGVDEVFHPSGAHARDVWDAEQILPAPAPTPGDGPGVITGNRIVIDTGLRHEASRDHR
ncbi:hypothetical protein [Microbacterium hominis]|uniref:Uncharacterized protein n=1 Tax=Microbacterium hominis TaxID=162426 RepID=A0A7D4TM09_9MICO|nr:hypothetical protein [Microbacterium hominis]QKJ18722.1 hypothetical protein HQM25_04520 [Microbacterium hominis]